MASIPRIMVLDTKNRLGNIVRAAMNMLDRRYIMIEIPSPDEALDEVFRMEIDLAVTAYKLDDTMNGIEWAERAIRERAGVPIIVATSDEDLQPSASRVQDTPFQFIPYTSGEQFLRSIRIGLDGEHVVAAEDTEHRAHLDLGPVPQLDLGRAAAILKNSIRDLGAIGALISDRAGRIVVDEGATSYIDKAEVAAMLGPNFAQAVKVAPQVGGSGWTMNYIEGDRYNLFALAIGYHYFLLYLVDAANKYVFGNITRTGRRDVNKIIDMLGDAAWHYSQTAEPEVVLAAEPVAPVVEAVIAEEPAAEAPAPEELASKLFEEQLEPVDNLDLDVLFSQQADEAAFADLFSADQLELDDDLLADQGSVSYEEAQNMGLLGD